MSRLSRKFCPFHSFFAFARSLPPMCLRMQPRRGARRSGSGPAGSTGAQDTPNEASCEQFGRIVEDRQGTMPRLSRGRSACANDNSVNWSFHRFVSTFYKLPWNLANKWESVPIFFRWVTPYWISDCLIILEYLPSMGFMHLISLKRYTELLLYSMLWKYIVLNASTLVNLIFHDCFRLSLVDT